MALSDTRRALHAVAELVLAGPQYAANAKIRLRITPNGFATVRSPDVRVDGTAVISGTVRAEIDGRTAADLAAQLARNTQMLYRLHPPLERGPQAAE